MSHTIGHVIDLNVRLGPGFGKEVANGVWESLFDPPKGPDGTKPLFVVLRFTNLHFADPHDYMTVGLGYGADRFSGRLLREAWSRPISGRNGPIAIRFHARQSAGGATLASYGRGEPTATVATPGTVWGNKTNPDLFLVETADGRYREPTYETRLKCGQFDWRNAATAETPAERKAVRATCVVVCGEWDPVAQRIAHISSCSGTLISDNKVITAGHCFAHPAENLVASVSFDYQTNPDGSRPANYAPRFYRVVNVWQPKGPNYDVAILDLDVPSSGLGIEPCSTRNDPFVEGEPVFTVHHPNAAVKKFQAAALKAFTPSLAGLTPEEYGYYLQVEGFDYAGGSSGSALFDANANLLGVALSQGPVPNKAGVVDSCQAIYSTAMQLQPVVPRFEVERIKPFDVHTEVHEDGSVTTTITGVVIRRPDGRVIHVGPIVINQPPEPPHPEWRGKLPSLDHVAFKRIRGAAEDAELVFDEIHTALSDLVRIEGETDAPCHDDGERKGHKERA